MKPAEVSTPSDREVLVSACPKMCFVRFSGVGIRGPGSRRWRDAVYFWDRRPVFRGRAIILLAAAQQLADSAHAEANRRALNLRLGG